MKGAFRRLVLEIARLTGFMRLWRFLHRREVIILKLHGVMDDEGGELPWTPLRPQLQRRRLEYVLREILKRYRIVSLDDAVDMLAGRKQLQPYSIVLTFDDGYRNNVKCALPVLRRYGAPATFFVSTGHVNERRPFWFDRLDYAVQHLPADGRELRFGDEVVKCGLSSRAELRELYKRMRDTAKKRNGSDLDMLAEMEAIAEKLESEGGGRLSDIFENDDWTAVLTWEEIRATLQEDVCFGSHTVDHVRLGMVDGVTVRDQLKRSKDAIERKTGRECRYVCFPSGSHSLEAAEIAKECGYVAALTTVEGMNKIGEDPMFLKRIGFPENGSIVEVLARVSGLSNWIFRKKTNFLDRTTELVPPVKTTAGTAS